MPSIKTGAVDVKKVYLGNTQVEKAYLGTNLVYQKAPDFILDQYPALHAHAMFKLRSAYTGPALRVSRTAGGPATTIDIQFNINNYVELDSPITYVSGATTLSTNLGQFLGVTELGYTNPDAVVRTSIAVLVDIYYDQSGNSKHLLNIGGIQNRPTFATNTSSPLYNKGLIRERGTTIELPTIWFSGNSTVQLKVAGDTTIPLNNANQIVSFEQNLNTSTGRVSSAFRTALGWRVVHSGLSSVSFNYNNTDYTIIPTSTPNTDFLFGLSFYARNLRAYNKNTEVFSLTGISEVSGNSADIVLGANTGSSGLFNGRVSTYVTWSDSDAGLKDKRDWFIKKHTGV